MTSPRSVDCPGCGAAIEFQIGASVLAVCPSCSRIVGRTGMELQILGQAADLIPTGSRLELGQSGQCEGGTFKLIGRAQWEWESGAWDEWYASFADGRWGWIAEAQGRYYVTFKVADRRVPARGSLEPEASVFVEGLGRFVVTDVKSPKLVTAQGELPSGVTLGAQSLTVDLEGKNRAFATLDYGASEEDGPQIFVGHQYDIDGLHLGKKSAAQPSGSRPSGEKLECPHCAGQIDLRIPEQTQHLTCTWCGALLDATQGPLRLVALLQKLKQTPPIPIGRKGTLRGVEYLVVGWMQRSCAIDGERFSWDELLLYDTKATDFAWLMRCNGHTQLALPISAADVEKGVDASFGGHRFRHFQHSEVRVDHLLGEFYWAVTVGETTLADDYVNPPEGLSCERSGHEVNWVHSFYVTPAEMRTAFAVQSQPERVDPIQPWPHEELFHTMMRWGLGGMLAAFALLVVFNILSEKHLVLEHSFSIQEVAVEDFGSGGDLPPAGMHAHTYLSEPFALPGNEAVEVQLASAVSNSWVAASGALIDEAGGELHEFDIENEYYSGVDDGEAWSEGKQKDSTELSAPPAGKYVLRADLMWDSKATSPPAPTLRVFSGGASTSQFLLALLLLIPPLLLAMRRSSFEHSRWEDSNVHTQPTGMSWAAVGAGSDEDDS